ncbi:unnamed protein product [Paramecium sonneborni]|uniref:Uncharacterized protein n=1 Tax=Paramecium sonneborni TaxID=65129 RepID=A0A8S1QWK2_9CILI|nr:unnamed protein product [Paramecium sonneborni]
MESIMRKSAVHKQLIVIYQFFKIVISQRLQLRFDFKKVIKQLSLFENLKELKESAFYNKIKTLDYIVHLTKTHNLHLKIIKEFIQSDQEQTCQNYSQYLLPSTKKIEITHLFNNYKDICLRNCFQNEYINLFSLNQSRLFYQLIKFQLKIFNFTKYFEIEQKKQFINHKSKQRPMLYYPGLISNIIQFQLFS